MGARFSTPVQTGPGVHTTSYTMGTGSSPEVKRPGRAVDHPFHLASRLKKSRAIPLLPAWAFMACSRANFTLNFVLSSDKELKCDEIQAYRDMTSCKLVNSSICLRFRGVMFLHR